MRFIILLVTTTLLLTILPSAKAQTPSYSELDAVCRQNASQFFRLTHVPVRADGMEYKFQGLYCVVVDNEDTKGPEDEYPVSWPATQMNNVMTIDGVVLSYFWTCAPVHRSTDVLVGGDTSFDVTIPIGKTKNEKCEDGIPKGLGWFTTSTVLGAVPNDLRLEERVQAYFVIRTTAFESGACVVTIINELANSSEQRISIRLPDDIAKKAKGNAIDQSRRVGPERVVFRYSFEGGFPVPRLFGLPITDHKGQEVATIPAVLCAQQNSG